MPQPPPDPVAWMLDHAPLDDEPETDAERRAVALAHADRARGVEPVPLDEVLREFHSTLDPPNGDHHEAMTAKEKLRVRVEELTEQRFAVLTRSRRSGPRSRMQFGCDTRCSLHSTA